MPSIPGATIRAWREEMEWSPSDLAAACNFTVDYLTRIEEDAVEKVHTRTYQKIANAFSLSLDEVATHPDEIRRGDIILEAPPEFRLLIRIILFLVLSLGVLSAVAISTAILSGGFLKFEEYMAGPLEREGPDIPYTVPQPSPMFGTELPYAPVCEEPSSKPFAP